MRLNRPIRSKGYVHRQQLYTVRWGNGFTTTLPLEVFIHKKLCSKLYSNELELYSQKQQIRFFEPPFGGVRVTYALRL